MIVLDVNSIKGWTDSKELRLNVNKTKAMVISRKKVKPQLKLVLDINPRENVGLSNYYYINSLLVHPYAQYSQQSQAYVRHVIPSI